MNNALTAFVFIAISWACPVKISKEKARQLLQAAGFFACGRPGKPGLKAINAC
ncbi:MAG: hypothetical protein RSE32_16095 [Comamonas sp.]|uniref:hypothetical protein n=1 Tax=Comamonas sp. TaxID=34028 RepID=UPI002FC9C958